MAIPFFHNESFLKVEDIGKIKCKSIFFFFFRWCDRQKWLERGGFLTPKTNVTGIIFI